MPCGPSDLFARLEALGIATNTRAHLAVFTVDESATLHHDLPGGHAKNLFLKDRKGRLFLVVAEQDTAIDLKRLHVVLGASGNFSFGSAALLRETLGVEPGSVTPFSLVNDPRQAVTVVLDARLMRHDQLNFHPLVNTMTTTIAANDLLVFLRAMGHAAVLRDLPAPQAADASPMAD